MPIPNPIAQAVKSLTTGLGTPKEKLRLGGKLLWAARTIPGNWTPELLGRANRIYGGLLQGGSLHRRLEQMDENAANKCLKQLAKDMAELAAGIEQARSQGRLPK